MRKFLVVACFSLVCSGLCASTKSTKSPKLSKIYVVESRARPHSKGFLIDTSKSSYIVRVLRHDSRGLYVLGKDIIVAPKGHKHHWWDTSCRRDYQADDEFLGAWSQRSGNCCPQGYPYDRPMYEPEADRYNGDFACPRVDIKW